MAAVDRAATEARAKGKPAKFIYVTPNFQNPAGLLMTQARRAALLDVALKLGGSPKAGNRVRFAWWKVLGIW